MPHDLNDSSPTSLNHIIGQTTVVDQLLVVLSACFEDHKRLDDCLLVGGPGLGKSQIAAVLGHELAVTTYEALGQSIKTASDLNALLLAGGDQAIIFIDEAHELSKTHQTALYLALDKRKIVVKGGKSFSSIPLANFTLLLGSTDEYCLLQPLRDRMRLILRFEFYTGEELTKIVVHRAKALQWGIDESLGQYWARDHWSDQPAEAVLFNRELDATEARNRYCLGGDEADTFTVTIVVTVHARRWSAGELARHLKRHQKFFIGGPASKEGLMMEIIPSTLKKVKP